MANTLSGMSGDAALRPVVPTGNEDVLNEDFPPYLREAAFTWLKQQVGVDDSGWVRGRFFVAFQNAARTDIGFSADQYSRWSTVLDILRRLDDADFTNLLDYALSQERNSSVPHPLDKMLSDGGFAWTVIPWNGSHARLAKRVSDGVQRAAKGVLAASDTASLKLQEAWLDAYGANPRASIAFYNAVVAVETAALSVVPVNKKDATLADLFSILEADSTKWQLVFRDSEKAPGGKTLAMMLRTLWRGHGSRHGSADYARRHLGRSSCSRDLGRDACPMVHVRSRPRGLRPL